MKRIVLLLLWVIASSCVYAQPLSRKFHDTQHGVEISYPSTWEQKNNTGSVFILVSPQDGPNDKFREHVNLTVIKNTTGHTLKTYGDATHKQLGRFKNYRRESVSYIKTYQGYELQKIIYGHSHTGSLSKIVLYQLIKDGNIYDITCSSTVLKFGSYAPLFEEIAKTFYLKNLTTPAVTQVPETPAVVNVPVKQAPPVNNGIKPVIDIVQPKVQRGVNYLCLDREITIKGTATSPNGVFEVLVNGEEAPLVNGSSFSHTLKLAYKNNQVTIKVTDIKGNVTEQSFVVERQMKVENVNDTLQRQGQDYALIIVTNTYDDFVHLTNPVNDGETLAKELRDNYGFKTEIVRDATRAHVYELLREYSKKTFADDDQLLIFFAGHGVYDDVFAEGYIVTKDSKKNDEVMDTYIPHTNLRTIINHIPCKHTLLVMDVCFGGAFEQSAVTISRGAELGDDVAKSKFIKRKMQYNTRRYLTSGGKEYVPDGRPGEHSPFARKCLEALRSDGGLDGILTFGEFYTFVEKATPEPRTGEFGDNQPGSDFLFIYKK